MTSPVYFTVEADFKAFIEDASTDSDYDPQVVPISATVTFTPLINSGDVVLATNASPRPTGFIPAPITAIIDPADGRLKMRTGTDAGATGFSFAPVRLLGSSPLLELSGALEYSVRFSEVVFSNGRRGTIAGFNFEAPNSDTVLNLIEVARVPGQVQSGITKIAPGGVRLEDGDIIFSFAGLDIPESIPFTPLFTSTEMTDSTTVGRAVITSVDAAAARTAIGAENAAMKGASGGYTPLDATGKVDAAYLPSYVDDVLSYANEAAFPVTGETGKIYVAQDTGDAFRWTGSAYLRISDRVTASGITDSTATGRAVITAADVPAVRSLIDTQRLQTLKQSAAVWADLVGGTYIHGGRRVALIDSPVSVSKPTTVTPGATNLLGGILPFTGYNVGSNTWPTGIGKQNASATKVLNSATDDTIDITFTQSTGTVFAGGLIFSTFTPTVGVAYTLSFTVECISTDSARMRVRPGAWNGTLGQASNRVNAYVAEQGVPRRVSCRLSAPSTDDKFAIFIDDIANASDFSARFRFSDFMLVAESNKYPRFGNLLLAPPYGQDSVSASDITINIPTAGDHMILVKTSERGWIASRATLTAGNNSLLGWFPDASMTVEEIAAFPSAVWQVGDLDVIEPPIWRSVRYRHASSSADYLQSYSRSPADLSEMLGTTITTRTAQTLDRPWAASVAVNRTTANRFEVRSGDQDITDIFGNNDSNRAEITSGLTLDFNTDAWVSFWIKIDGTVDTESFSILMQLRQIENATGDTSTLSPPFSFQARDDNEVSCVYRTDGGTAVLSGSGTPTGITTVETQSVSYTPGKWHRNVFKINNSDNGGGHLSWWWDGVQIVSGDVALGYDRDQPPNIRFGIYRPSKAVPLTVTYQHLEISTSSLASRITAPLPV